MDREEKIAMLVKAKQLYTFEEWYEATKTLYLMRANKRSPQKDYEEYVNETFTKFPD